MKNLLTRLTNLNELTMLKYKVNICGKIDDTDTDFRCGFDFIIENGGSVENIGEAIQAAIDLMKDNGTPNHENGVD